MSWMRSGTLLSQFLRDFLPTHVYQFHLFSALAVSMPHFSGTLYGHTSFMAYQNMVGMKYDFEITFSLILDNDTTTSSGSMFLMGSTGTLQCSR